VQLQSNLKTILDERNLSIRQVSKDIDYRFESVRQLYNNDTKQFPRDLLVKLCAYLEVDISDLLKLDRQD